MNFLTTIDRYFDCINRRDREAWLAVFSDHTGLHHADPVGGEVRCTKEQLGAFWDFMMGLFENIHLQPEATYPAPGRVALQFVGRGRGRNGAQVEFRGIDLIESDPEGKILRLEAFWDPTATLQRLMA